MQIQQTNYQATVLVRKNPTLTMPRKNKSETATPLVFHKEFRNFCNQVDLHIGARRPLRAVVRPHNGESRKQWL
jgi:hypothetical protein